MINDDDDEDDDFQTLTDNITTTNKRNTYLTLTDTNSKLFTLF